MEDPHHLSPRKLLQLPSVVRYLALAGGHSGTPFFGHRWLSELWKFCLRLLVELGNL